MINLIPVSKYQKQQFAIQKKYKLSLTSKQTILQQCQQQQIDPINIITYKQIQNNIKYQQRFFQNSNLTKYIHTKILTIKISIMLLIIISIIISILENQVIGNNQKNINYFIILIFHSINTISIIGLLLIQYYLIKQLRNKQLIKVSISKSWSSFRILIFNIILIIFHPNVFTNNIILNLPQPIFGTYYPQKLNNIFQIIMLTRIYLIYITIIQSSFYSSTRANRICRIYGTKHNQIFIIKALFNNYPLRMLLTIFSTLLIIFGQMLKISQKNLQTQFNDVINSVWCILITMGTIGYGDYIPHTYIGRIVTFLAAMSGIIIASLFILTLSKYLSMSNNQNKSHLTMQRLQFRQNLQKYCLEVIHQTHRLSKFPNNQSYLQQLKKKTQKVKLTLRRIRNIIDTDNISQEVNRLFQVLTNNLKEIYLNQLKYKILLQKIYQQNIQNIRQMKFSFTTEIQDIIKDR